jgi:hypothetical protein
MKVVVGRNLASVFDSDTLPIIFVLSTCTSTCTGIDVRRTDNDLPCRDAASRGIDPGHLAAWPPGRLGAMAHSLVLRMPMPMPMPTMVFRHRQRRQHPLGSPVCFGAMMSIQASTRLSVEPVVMFSPSSTWTEDFPSASEYRVRLRPLGEAHGRLLAGCVWTDT